MLEVASESGLVVDAAARGEEVCVMVAGVAGAALVGAGGGEAAWVEAGGAEAAWVAAA